MKFKMPLSILLLILVGCLLQCCSKKADPFYGFKTEGKLFKSAFYSTNVQLEIKDYESFENAYNSHEYKQIVKEVERHSTYAQAEGIFLPIIQRVERGNKYVFMFEKVTTEDDYPNLEHISFECNNLDKNTATFPENCAGYLLVDTNNWPPLINEIINGYVNIQSKDLLLGHISGTIEIILDNNSKMKGRFSVFDKSKVLFLSIPAR